MRVAVVTEPYKVEIKEANKPKANSKDVLIKVKTAGICGSDLHLFKGTHAFRKLPAILGHEMAGEVIEVGNEVTKIKIGDRVTVEPQIGCGECEQCRQGFVNLCTNKIVPGTPKWGGTFADYFVAPENTVYKLGENVSYELGTLIEPLAVAVHAVRRISSLNNNSKKSMAILGSGTIGLLSLVVAKKLGFDFVMNTDTVEFNLDKAKKYGSDVTANPLKEDILKLAKDVTDNKGFDVAIVAAGSKNILDQASSIVKRRGQIVLIAMITQEIPFYSYSIVFNEQTLTGAMTYQSRDFSEATDLINNGLDLSGMITQRLPMEETQKGLEMLDKKIDNIVKIIVYPEK